MPLRFLYFFYILVVHGFVAWLLYEYFDNKWYFLFSEIGILLSLIISYAFFRKFNEPLQLMKYGVDAIKDEDYNVRFLKTGSDNVNELIQVFNTFLEKLTEERVSTQEQGYFLESIINASPIGMIMLDYDDHIASFNGAAAELFGSDVLFKDAAFFKIQHPLIFLLAQLEMGAPDLLNVNPTQRYRCRINSIVHLGFKRKFIMIEELSKELLENEKAAYGKVIRMMAHEVNNSMGAVNSILQSVIDFAFDAPDNEYIEFLKVAKSRNKELAGFMKNFADVIRLPPPNVEPTNLGDLVGRAKLIMSSLAETAQVDLSINAPTLSVVIPCDAGQIQQVVINAIKNAIESIGQDGQIVLTVQPEQPQLIIADNGPGIDPAVKDQLFSPFFSTKPDGQGIGLIISREILASHGAQFELYTEEGSGWTRFEVRF